MKPKTFSTSEICQICNLSRKKLRYYEEKGLLKDILRDDNNNYRRYTTKDINNILIIRNLQRIGFSLNEILDLSSNDSLNGLQQMIKKRMLNAKEELRQSMHRYEQSTEKYVQLLEAVSFLKTELATENQAEEQPSFQISTFPSQYVISLAYEGTFLDEENEIKKIISQLYNIIEEYDITTLDSLISIYRRHFDPISGKLQEGHHPIEICLPASNIRKPCPYYKKLEQLTCLSTVYIGSFNEQLIETYAALFDWAKANQIQLANYSIEENLIGPLLTSNEKHWVTNIMIPLQQQRK